MVERIQSIEELLTYDMAGKLLGVTSRTVWTLVDRGDLPAVRFGKSVRIDPEDLREFAPGAEIYFERVAVMPEQIESLGLPTRPTKKTDSRSKNFKGESVDVDAIPPATLRQMVTDCIEKHIDTDLLGMTQNIEESERESLQEFVQN